VSQGNTRLMFLAVTVACQQPGVYKWAIA